ncbi:MAG: ferrochelatase [Actinomycetota bacterium]|nr:ferrochelatase [Actinomycetota bacterium]
MSQPMNPDPYDAVLLVSFGGPEGPADVLPFLENVTRGRGIPRERLVEVGSHYHGFGGRSPINDQCRAFRSAVEADLKAHDLDVPVYWGNRNWDPYLSDTVGEMQRAGVRRVACFVTSAYSSYSGCRQYRENLFDAVAEAQAAQPPVPHLDKLRHYYNHPGFVEPFVAGAVDALQRLAAAGHHGVDEVRLVFVTHSIPVTMNEASGRSADTEAGAYVRQHQEVARLVSDGVEAEAGQRYAHELVYCSRSGPPHVPWLEPDISDHLATLVGEPTGQVRASAVVVVPIGFVSDHMEVVYDLDTEAAASAAELGLGFARVPTPGTDPRFVRLVRDLLLERAAVERANDETSGQQVPPPPRAALGRLGPSWDVCPAGCCANPRAERPALCGTETEVPTHPPATSTLTP